MQKNKIKLWAPRKKLGHFKKKIIKIYILVGLETITSHSTKISLISLATKAHRKDYNNLLLTNI